MPITVGVQLIVRNGSHILLGQRANAFQSGSWGLPGGHLESGETLLQAAARELLEETGLIAREMRVFCVTDPILESNFHLQIGVEALSYSGTPRILEPRKCTGLGFFSLANLPQPLFISSVGVIRNYQSGSFYSHQGPIG